MPLLFDRVLESVARFPERSALIAGSGTVTYRQLLALVSVTAAHLHERGVRVGDLVGLWMGQTPLHLVTFLALARIGAVTLPMYPNVRPSQRVELMRRHGARFVVTDTLIDSGGIPGIGLNRMHARGDESDFSFTEFVPGPDAPLRIALTSGTTGRQKAMLHTHGLFAARAARRFYGEATAPRVIPAVLHITGSLSLACHALCAGGAVVFPAGDDAPSVMRAIRDHSVTNINLPPADLAVMLSLLREDTPAFPSIVQLRVVGATPSPALVELARRRFSPNLYALYAMTETGAVAVAAPASAVAVPGSVGRVVPGARVEILGEDGQALPPGAVGEIRAATDNMTGGYYGADAAIAGFRDGWFHPGDRGHFSADGFLFVEGRRDAVLNIGGHKASSEHLESILRDHPNVWEAAVFPIDDAVAGMRVGAAIVTRGALDWKRLSSHARASLGPMAPTRYFSVERLPRNAMGKLDRPELPAWVAANGEPIE